MSFTKRWMPHPVVSGILFVAWLMLNQTVSAGHIVLGAALGLLIPMFTDTEAVSRTLLS